MRSPEEIRAAAEALREVGQRARVYLSMPVIEGVTPRALVQASGGNVSEDPGGLPRKDGIFELDEVGLSPMDHVALYGDAAFEGILIRNGSIFLYREHMDRMDRSLEKVGIEMPVDRVTLTERLAADGAAGRSSRRDRLHPSRRDARHGGSGHQPEEVRVADHFHDRQHHRAVSAPGVRGRDPARAVPPDPPPEPLGAGPEHQEQQLPEQRAGAAGRHARHRARRVAHADRRGLRRRGDRGQHLLRRPDAGLGE